MKVYIIANGHEYLASYRELFTGTGNYTPLFSIYYFDAARIRDLYRANEIRKALGGAGKWKILELNTLTGYLREIC